MRLTIERVRVPGDPDAFRDFVDVGNDCALHLWNNDDFVHDPADELTWYRTGMFRLRMLYLARLDGEPAGRLLVTVPLEEESTTAEIDVQVIPAARRHGIGTALLRRGEALVEDAGRIDVASFTQHVLEGHLSDVDTIMPATGPTGVPVDDATRFALAAGYRLGQVEVVSRLALPLPEAVHERLSHKAGVRSTGYRLVTWSGRCPDGLVRGYAAARDRMALDVPHEGVALDAAHWDVPRLRAEEQRWIDAGEPPLVTAAVHGTSGEVVAYTILLVAQGSAKVEQRDTLVIAAHRGHRLGLAVKLANLDALSRLAPGVRRILTWNSGENGPMRAINDDLGFAPCALDGNWQRHLS